MKRWMGLLILAAILAGCVPETAAETGQADRGGDRVAAATRAAKPGGSQQGTDSPAGNPPGQAAPGQIPEDWVPPIDEVATLHLHLGMPVPQERAPQPLYSTHPEHRVTIATLLDLLARTRLAPGEISMPARSPSLQVVLQGGGSLSVRLAYTCTPFSSEAGHGYTCRQAPGELILHTRQGHEVRVTNPLLAEWLLSGWQSEIPIGTLPDMDRGMALAVARKVDPKANWKSAFHEEYPVEGKGGTEVRRAWVVEAEYPSGSRTRLVIDARSGEVIQVGQLEALP